MVIDIRAPRFIERRLTCRHDDQKDIIWLIESLSELLPDDKKILIQTESICIWQINLYHMTNFSTGRNRKHLQTTKLKMIEKKNFFFFETVRKHGEKRKKKI